MNDILQHGMPWVCWSRLNKRWEIVAPNHDDPNCNHTIADIRLDSDDNPSLEYVARRPLKFPPALFHALALHAYEMASLYPRGPESITAN